MKAVSLTSAVALLALAIAGCSSNHHQDSHRDAGTSTSHSGDRDDWNRLHADPVCGMTVNPKDAVKESYHGNTYYFDNEECARKFRDNPSAYVDANGQNKRNVK
jgi:YHS domain-containing protein